MLRTCRVKFCSSFSGRPPPQSQSLHSFPPDGIFTVSALKRLLENGRINEFCSVVRDGAVASQSSLSSSSSSLYSHHHHHVSPLSAAAAGGSTQSSFLHLLEAKSTSIDPVEKKKRQQQHDADELADDDWQDDHQREYSSSARRRERDDLRGLLRTAVHAAFYRPGSDPVLPASWTVLANIACSQGMWRRAVQVFDRMIALDKKPSPHAVAQTLRPGNTQLIRRWCAENNVPLDIVTGMRVLVEYSDDWAAALRLALQEEAMAFGSDAPRSPAALVEVTAGKGGGGGNNKKKQPQSRRRSSSSSSALKNSNSSPGNPAVTREFFSLGALIPYLANGGHWRTAAAVLGNALAQGSLVRDSLVRMIIRSTAQQRTWVSCLALTSTLSSALALQPANKDTPADMAELQGTLRAVAAVCPTWAPACALITVCRRAGAPCDRYIVGSAMEKCEAAGRWADAAAAMRLAVAEGCVADSAEAGRRLVDVFRAETQWAGAVRALTWMARADTAAAAAGLLTTIELCAAAGQWRAAAEIGSRVLVSRNEPASAVLGSGDHLLLLRKHQQQHQQHDEQQQQQVVAAGRPMSSYVALIQVLSAAGRWAEAAQAFAQMAGDSTVRSPSVESCELVLRACGGRWEAALGFFGCALQWEPRVLLPVSSYETVVQTCLAAARWREAVEILRLQRRNGVQLDPEHSRTGMWACALLSSSCLQQQQLVEKREREQMMKTASSVRPTNWVTCLQFFRTIPPRYRTPRDTELVVQLSMFLQRKQESADAAKALQKALFRA